MNESFKDSTVRQNKRFNFFIDTRFTDTLYVLCAGHADCDKSDISSTVNRLHYYSLHFVLRGKGNLIVNQKHFNLTAGDMFLIHANIPTQHDPDPDDPYEIVWINFVGPYTEKLLPRLDLTADRPIYHFDNPDIVQKIIRIYVDLIEAHTQSTACDLKALSALFELCTIVCESKRIQVFTSKPLPTTSEHINKSLLYIQNNYSKKNLTLQEVSEYLNLHPNYFSKLFHEKTNMCFSDYIRQYRIHKAMNIMDNGNFYIKEVADMVGYSDPLHFSKEFKKIVHISPKSYTKKLVF